MMMLIGLFLYCNVGNKTVKLCSFLLLSPKISLDLDTCLCYLCRAYYVDVGLHLSSLVILHTEMLFLIPHWRHPTPTPGIRANVLWSTDGRHLSPITSLDSTLRRLQIDSSLGTNSRFQPDWNLLIANLQYHSVKRKNILWICTPLNSTVALVG